MIESCLDVKPASKGPNMCALLGTVSPALINSCFKSSRPETVVQPTSPKDAAAQGGELQVGLAQVLLPVLPVLPVLPLGGADPRGGCPKTSPVRLPASAKSSQTVGDMIEDQEAK